MKVAVKYGALSSAPLATPDGHASMESGQATVARRILDLFPGAVAVGSHPQHTPEFEIVSLASLDPADTLVINMDVLDSIGVFQRLHRSGAEPKIMNFQWVPPSTYQHPANFAALGLAYSLFPTFCSGERTAAEVREVVERWAIPSLANRARIASAELGIDASRPVLRIPTEEPVVLYPAITMEPRKHPEDFIKIVSAVAKKTPIRVVARLAPSSLVSTPAMNLAAERWSSVSPLRGTSDDYWTELAKTAAFVATAHEESYGLVYVEAMRAGAIGILPNLPWATKLVPSDYPYLYQTLDEAEELLHWVVTHPQEASDAVDEAVGGGHFTDWIRANHDRRTFDEAFQAQVRAWFGDWE